MIFHNAGEKVYALISAVHIIVCVLLVGIVLLQQGKGADTGAVFGGGSNTLFGASGADNLLTKVTTGLAALFFGTSIYLAINVREPIPTSDTGSALFKDLPQATAPQNQAKATGSVASEAAAPVAETPPALPATEAKDSIDDSAAANSDVDDVVAEEVTEQESPETAPQELPAGQN